MENEKPLGEYTRAEIPLIPLYSNGVPSGPWGKPGPHWRTSRAGMLDSWNQGFRAFAFVPSVGNLFVLDVDLKGGKNGFQEGKDFFLSRGQVPPQGLRTPDKHPCYVRTPSGGYHLYYTTKKRWQSGPLDKSTPGLEGISFNHLVTAGGSKTDKGTYTLFGSLFNAPPLPDLLVHTLDQREKKALEDWEKRLDKSPAKGVKGGMTIPQIIETMTNQGYIWTTKKKDRNIFLYAFSRFARKQGHPELSVEEWARNNLIDGKSFKLGEAVGTINSAYKGKKNG